MLRLLIARLYGTMAVTDGRFRVRRGFVIYAWGKEARYWCECNGPNDKEVVEKAVLTAEALNKMLDAVE